MARHLSPLLFFHPRKLFPEKRWSLSAVAAPVAIVQLGCRCLESKCVLLLGVERLERSWQLVLFKARFVLIRGD